jgi:hypothetical protein
VTVVDWDSFDLEGVSPRERAGIQRPRDKLIGSEQRGQVARPTTTCCYPVVAILACSPVGRVVTAHRAEASSVARLGRGLAPNVLTAVCLENHAAWVTAH